MHLTSYADNNNTDDTLQYVIEIFEANFPQRIRAYYVQGSYADASSVRTSDLDILLVYKVQFKNDEYHRAEELVQQLVHESILELDIECIDEQRCVEGISPTLKLGSTFLFGEDVRAMFPLVSLEEWTRDRMHSSLWRTVHLCNRPPLIRYPLTYPDPQGEFYGYDARMLRLPNGEEVHCTRDLIRLVGWSATAIIAFKAGKYVARKSECHKMYQACFDDEWGELLQSIYELCRGQWNYLIPSGLEERKRLRTICECTLGFENHFLQIYKEFVLKELRSSDTKSRQQALSVLQDIEYQDEEIFTAIIEARAAIMPRAKP